MTTGTFLARYEKQTTEILDYKFDFGEWLIAKDRDTISSVSVDITRYPPLNEDADPEEAPLDKQSPEAFTGNVVSVFLKDGTDGSAYKVACTIETVGGRTKIGNILVRIVNP